MASDCPTGLDYFVVVVDQCVFFWLRVFWVLVGAFLFQVSA